LPLLVRILSVFSIQCVSVLHRLVISLRFLSSIYAHACLLSFFPPLLFLFGSFKLF
jgi:hypothetical protein